MPARSATLEELVESWTLSLTAARKSPKTVKGYLEAVALLAAFRKDRGLSTEVGTIDVNGFNAFMTDQVKRWKDTTAATRYRCLQQFFKWAEAERELPNGNPMATTKPPAIGKPLIPLVEAEDLRALLGACDGSEFNSQRDLAILTVFIDTGVRLSEMAGMKLADVDLPHRRIKVLGKGGKERMVPLGDKAQLTLDRYLRARRRQHRATSPKLWLGHVGDGLGTEGIAQMLRRRCRQAGLAELHPHQLRHTFADAWLDAGGSEGNLMEIGGWDDPTMVRRYGRAGAARRALAAHRNLSPADRL